MKLRIVQAVLAITIVVLVVMAQLTPGSPYWRVSRWVDLARAPLGQPATALADEDNDDADNDDEDNDDGDADNEDEDNADNDDDADNDDSDEDNDDSDEDNDDDADNDDEDNDDSDSDNDDADNDDADSDNEFDDDDLYEDADNTQSASGSAVGPSYAFDPSVTVATGQTVGADGRIALPGDRIVVQVFPWMPAGITLSVRLIDAATVSVPTGTRVDALVFQIEATDAAGVALSQLPAEVNLSVRYTDQEVSGVNEQFMTLLWQDPFDQQWKPAPKLVTDPPTNYLAASVTGVGTYAVVIP